MSRNLFTLLLAVTLVAIVVACSTNAITGRKQLSLVSDAELQTTALTQYKQFLSESKVVAGTKNKDAEMVKRVGARIANAIGTYYQNAGAAEQLKNYQWEFNLVEGADVNAWCMPGGKVVVYTGLLPVTKNEAGLAIVMGHEISHAIASHGKERMSQEMLAQGLQMVGTVALGGNPKALNVFNQVYAPTAQLGVLLPNSRNQELEADKFGLVFAAMAGYNPQEAIPFWTRMANLGGQKPPLFLSTHPSDEQRIAQLKALMPEALKYYKPVSVK